MQAAWLAVALLENAVTAVISIPVALIIAFAFPFLIFSFEALLCKIFGGLCFFGMRMKWYRAASLFIHKALLLKPADPQLIEAQGQCLHRSGRLSSALVFSLVFLLLRPRVALTRTALPLIAAVGVFDTSANGLFALATTQGYLSIVAVLGTLYPVVTVLLAFVVLRERIATHQVGGAVATLVGVALIAAG